MKIRLITEREVKIICEDLLRKQASQFNKIVDRLRRRINNLERK